MFKDCEGILPDLTDFPVNKEISACHEVQRTSEVENLSSCQVSDLMKTDERQISGNKSSKVYICMLCQFENRLRYDLINKHGYAISFGSS